MDEDALARALAERDRAVQDVRRLRVELESVRLSAATWRRLAVEGSPRRASRSE